MKKTKQTAAALLSLTVILGTSAKVFADDADTVTTAPAESTAEASAETTETAVSEESTAETEKADEAAEKEDYTETEKVIHIMTPENTDSITVRFYSDKPEIPYISLSEYYGLLTGGTMEIEPFGTGSTYSLRTSFGGEAVADTEGDTLSSDNFDAFNNTTVIKEASLPNTYYDGAPFVRVSELSVDKDPAPMEIDFSKYSIDLKEDESGKDIWLPALTASDLFSGAVMYHCVYDGNDFHILDCNAEYNTITLAESEDYLNSISSAFAKDGKRSKALAEYGYNEFCFMYDTFFGFPGRVPLEKELTGGLDEALKNHNEITAKAREWLMSEDPAEYTAAALILEEYLYDGGHSSFSSMPYAFMTDETLTVRSATLLQDIGFEFKNYLDYYSKVGNTEIMSSARSEAWGDETFFIEGDTAYFVFDEFTFDISGWDDYYKNGGELPDDVIGSFKKALDTAEADPNVKNFVLDLTSNSGGSADVVVAMTAMMTGDAYIEYDNTLSGQNTHVEYEVDTNFNGVFGDEEDMVPYSLNFGILTSDFSFSCANLLPCIAHDSGIPLIGEHTGGGACAVYISSTQEGGIYTVSSPMRLTDKNGNNIDPGLDVDYDITDTDENGGVVYSDLYDTETISRCMNEFYGTEPEAAVTEEVTVSEETETVPEAAPVTASTEDIPRSGNAPAAEVMAVMAAGLVTALLSSGKRRK